MLLATTLLAANLCSKAPQIAEEVLAAKAEGKSHVTLMFHVRNSGSSPSVKFWLNQTIITLYSPTTVSDESKVDFILLSCDNKEIQHEHQYPSEGR